jgi:hypothetical protein
MTADEQRERDEQRANAVNQALLDFAALLAEAAITLDRLVTNLVGEVPEQ